ncbi:MAG: hypothetical protein KKF56_05200 [Nanoarchaeota archaeon]|nr:hypothetical protein [Nanoarchaeota archaeon]
MIIECNKRKGGCGSQIEIADGSLVEEYVECPICGKISPNPLYDGEEKNRSYVG